MSRLWILVVDDQEPVRDLIARRLSSGSGSLPASAGGSLISTMPPTQ